MNSDCITKQEKHEKYKCEQQFLQSYQEDQKVRYCYLKSTEDSKDFLKCLKKEIPGWTDVNKGADLDLKLAKKGDQYFIQDGRVNFQQDLNDLASYTYHKFLENLDPKEGLMKCQG